MSLKELVLQTAQSLGLELIDTTRSTGGLLRVTIEWPWQPGQAERAVQVEDCEKLTRQLQYALEVEGVDYRRLEVSSPGIDRLLRNEADFHRFSGQHIEIVLNQPSGQRKKFRGFLESQGDHWQICWRNPPAIKPGAKVSRKKELPPEQVLVFRIQDIKEARLAPIVDYKGRANRVVPAIGESRRNI